MYFKWNIRFQWLLLLFIFSPASIPESHNWVTSQGLLLHYFFSPFSVPFIKTAEVCLEPPCLTLLQDLNFSKFKENKNYNEKPWIYIDSFEELKAWETSPMVRVKVTKYKTWNPYILVSLSFFCTIPKTPYWKW